MKIISCSTLVHTLISIFTDSQLPKQTNKKNHKGKLKFKKKILELQK